MSEYDYDDRRGSDRTRFREPEYVSETTYIQRGHGRPPQDLVVRGREDSTEEIPRDFPPSAEYRRSHVRDNYAPPARSRRDPRYDDQYDDDYYSDYGPSPPRAPRSASGRHDNRRRDDRGDDYYSDDYGRPKPNRRKSKIESTLEGLGLGGAVGALLGKSSGEGQSHGGGYEEDRAAESRKKWQQAAKAAVISGVVEAVRSRNEPGGWAGPKGQRVATAALGAAGIDGLVNMGRDPRSKSKRHVLESVVGGLAANRIANGPRDRSGSRGRSRSRSRSRSTGGLRARSRSLFRSLSRGRQHSRSDSYSPSPSRARSKSRGLKELAAVGGIAAAGKAIYDRVRSKSRGRTRDASVSSEDSYVPGRRQRYGTDRRPPAGMEDGTRGRDLEAGEGAPRGGELVQRKRDSSSDSVSTTDMETQRKKMRGKELLTAGLATIATIHAAHGVYSSMVASEKRHKLVEEGEMSPEEARKRKSKNMLQDAAAVGIAALGIKSAFSEWKEMNEHRHEVHELEEKRRKRRKEHEKRERELRMNGGGYGGQNYAYNSSAPNQYNDNYNLPPPPMGAQSYR